MVILLTGSYQLSAISYQLSAISYHRATRAKEVVVFWLKADS
jgi:hypothetical protein